MHYFLIRSTPCCVGKALCGGAAPQSVATAAHRYVSRPMLRKCEQLGPVLTFLRRCFRMRVMMIPEPESGSRYRLY